jgi:hypothetical protein
MRQRRRSTSATIAAFAFTRPGLAVNNPLAACVACCIRMAMWNQSRIGGFVTPGIGQYRPQTRTTVGKRGHLGGLGLPRGFKVSQDQRHDVSVSLRHRCKHLSFSGGGLDVADAEFHVARAIFAAADEGRTQADCDRRCRGGSLIDRRIAKLLASPQRMAAQCLRALPSVDRQQVHQHISRNPIGHQCRQPRLQLVELKG